jgi:putative ABC transport system permease protein
MPRNPLAPFFLWIGLTLLLSRILAGGVSRGASVIQKMLHSIFGDLGKMAGKSIIRRAPKIASAIVIVSLALSFGISLSIFINTYQTQKSTDARYSLGSDIKVTIASGIHQQPAAFAQMIEQVSGVTAASPVQLSQAYVGSTLQNVYGIDPQTYVNASDMPDSYFVNISANQAMADMASIQNGALVSEEMAKAYDIVPGDPIIISLANTATVNGPTVETRLQVVGIIRFFPTATNDTFVVMNQNFMQTITRNDKISYFLVRTSASPHDVAASIQDKLGSQVSMKTEDIDTAILALGNSMTSLNLKGLGNIEQGYSVIIISLGLMIFLLSMVYERAKEFGAMRAIGGSVKQIERVLWSESLTVGVLSIGIGGIIGLPLGKVFVSLLKVLYTIPPKGIVIPFGALFALLFLVIVGMVVATYIANRRLARMDIAEVLREL